MRRDNKQSSASSAAPPRHALFRERLQQIAWEAFLLISCFILGSVCVSQFQTLYSLSAPPLHKVFIATISAAGTALTLWNITNAVIAHLGTMSSIPRWLRRICTAFVERWGTAHARQILLRSGAQLALGVGTFSMGITPIAIAADLPTPDLPPSSNHSIDAPMSEIAPLPELPATASPSPENPAPPVTATGSAQGTNPVAQDARRRMEQAQRQQHAPQMAPSTTSDNAAEATPNPNITHEASSPNTHTQPSARASLPTVLPTPTVKDTRPAPHSHTVTSGECLWSIAADFLPRDSSDADIARAWQEIYSLNRAVIGPDPDVIIPGTVLTLPTTL